MKKDDRKIVDAYALFIVDSCREMHKEDKATKAHIAMWVSGSTIILDRALSNPRQFRGQSLIGIQTWFAEKTSVFVEEMFDKAAQELGGLA